MAEQTRCTCGGRVARGHYDVTSFCDQGTHESCGGRLRGATGFHWWCACECHPEPEPSDTARLAHNEAALRTWRNAAPTLAPPARPDAAVVAGGEGGE